MQLMRADYEPRLASITNLYQTAHRQCSDYERLIYDLEGRLESTQSDLKAAQQELSSRVRELENIHQVLHSLEREATHSRQRSEEQWSEKVLRLQGEWREKSAEETRDLQHQLLGLQEELSEARRLVEDERLLKRKIEIEMVSEKKKLHTTLQHALSQLQNSQNDSIDRLLIKNLLLRYFQQKRSLEVLSLIARVLQFSSEERVVIGLEVPTGSIITSLFQSFANPLMGIATATAASPQPKAPSQGEVRPPSPLLLIPHSLPPQGDNLAELWLSYLIHESEEEAVTVAAPLSPPHRQHSDPSPASSPSPFSAMTSSGSTPTAPARMPSFLSKPPLLRTPSLEDGDGNDNLLNGVRQVAPSPVLYPLHH
jgi:hypothetical protein